MRKIIDGEIVDIDKMSIEELNEFKSDLIKKTNELELKMTEKIINENINLFEVAAIKWSELTTHVIALEANLFIKEGKEEIETKIDEAKSALESRGKKYGLRYDDIVEKYSLDEEKSGNLLGDYKNSLKDLNDIYKKAYKSLLDVRLKTVNELEKIYDFIIKLQKENDLLHENYIDYKQHEKKLKDLILNAKKAIEKGEQDKALEISNEIEKEKQNNPLKEFDNKLKLLCNQKNIYEKVLDDCEKQLKKYYEERKSKLRKIIIIEPIENKALTVYKKKFWEFWKK